MSPTPPVEAHAEAPSPTPVAPAVTPTDAFTMRVLREALDQQTKAILEVPGRVDAMAKQIVTEMREERKEQSRLLRQTKAGAVSVTLLAVVLVAAMAGVSFYYKSDSRTLQTDPTHGTTTQEHPATVQTE